jgi:putative polymerase
MAANMCLLALLRGGPDLKAVRDLAIPILFLWAGMNAGSMRYADRILGWMVAIVVAVGIFEWLFLDLYTEYFNVYSYYVSLGRLTESTEYVNESRLQLNGMRPDEIGRTILPMIFGSHRVSSVFLEPVSLGNFSVIVAAWGLSKGHDERRTGWLFFAAACLLIAMADSRYGLVTVGLLLALRFMVRGPEHAIAFAFPFLAIALNVCGALFLPDASGDNFLGRLVWAGKSLLEFSAGLTVGWEAPTNFYGDMGYAYVISRFGILLCLLLWFCFCFIKMADERGLRYRAYLSLYLSLILCVSGQSLFALKTAGLIWFLLGCCMARNEARPQPQPMPFPYGRAWQAH